VTKPSHKFHKEKSSEKDNNINPHNRLI
jgi:hypothetical protein